MLSSGKEDEFHRASCRQSRPTAASLPSTSPPRSTPRASDGSFTVNGKTVGHGRSLSTDFECLEKKAPETAAVPEHRETDAIRRMTLSGKVSASGKEYILTLK